MARAASSASRTSLYRLKGLTELTHGIRKKYRDDELFEVTELRIKGRDALLVRGAMKTPSVSWAGALHALTDETITLGNVTAAAVLLIRPGVNPAFAAEAVHDEEDEDENAKNEDAAEEDEDAGEADEADDEDADEDEEDGSTGAWALTYGMGFQLLEMDKVDAGFGQRIALRTADPRELQSLTRTTLDQRSRTDRASIPAGDDLRGFGAGAMGELVTRLVAKAEIATLTGGGKPIRIRGADALSVPLGKKPGRLLKDLDELGKILRRKVPDKELALLEQLVAVKNPNVLDELEADLAAELGDSDSIRLGLSWPHERVDENGLLTSFRIKNGGSRRFAKAQDGEPYLEAVLVPLKSLDVDRRVERLKMMRVQLFSDAEGKLPVSGAIPAIRWITFETERDGKRYCLHDGSWYLMDQEYADRLRTHVQAIFDRDPGVELPDWPADAHEDRYNKDTAQALGGLCLDRNLIRTEAHRSGIEVCDILLPDGAPVHVKKISGSSAASHQLAQALVSTDSLVLDEEARRKFREKVEQAGWNPDDLPRKPQRVVLGIARKGEPVEAKDLFTFTQVTLVRQAQVLRDRGVEVVVAPIRLSQ